MKIGFGSCADGDDSYFGVLMVVYGLSGVVERGYCIVVIWVTFWRSCGDGVKENNRTTHQTSTLTFVFQ